MLLIAAWLTTVRTLASYTPELNIRWGCRQALCSLQVYSRLLC